MEQHHPSSPPLNPSTSPRNLQLPNLQNLKFTPSGTPLTSPMKETRTPGSSSPSISHRSSFADNLRGIPPSPRAQQDAKFMGRDWRTITVGEIIAAEEVRFVEVDTSVEDATKLLVNSGAPNVILIREHKNTRTAIGTFDYDDLNAYLLLVTGLAYPADTDQAEVESILSRARNNQSIPLKDIKGLLGRKEPPAFLEHKDTLTKTVEIFGSGFHRIIVREVGSPDVVGVLSQLRLVRFFWQNMTSFRAVGELYQRSLKELDIGSHTVISINGDKPLKEALLLMHNEGVTSLPVLDNHKNVIGNISHVDVKLLTTTFLPVFHVTPFNTLAHTVAKLVATRSHRMWIVDAPSPASSVPPSPGMPPMNPASMVQHATLPGPAQPTSGPPYTPANPPANISAASLPGTTLSGRLSGVISLTDVLNLYARATGLSPQDPNETRQRRRRSSSASVRHSLDSVRSVELGRSGSQRR
ncbi:cell separation during budding [Taxawa tesnikishii (nom. ined.)]|nr:cell separation during budding [Dothideales sp. JES 119]